MKCVICGDNASHKMVSNVGFVKYKGQLNIIPTNWAYACTEHVSEVAKECQKNVNEVLNNING